MASLNNSRMLFFTTSPRTPFKMIPEIELLGNNFSGQKWSKYTQVNFIELLSQEGFFNGKGSKNNLDFSARDRINRAPKALGFVSLNPTTLIISKKPGNTGISRDIRTEFTTDLLLSD